MNFTSSSKWKIPELKVTEIDAINGFIRFRVTNLSDFDLSIDDISAQLITCSQPTLLLSNDDNGIIEKRIDLGIVQFDTSRVIKKVSDSDVIYTLKPNTSAFFKIRFLPDEVSRARNNDCKSKSKDLDDLAVQGKPGDLFLRLSFPNQITGVSQKIINKIN